MVVDDLNIEDDKRGTYMMRIESNGGYIYEDRMG